jgi:hypothetical protein
MLPAFLLLAATLDIPRLPVPPTIDADLSDWKERAFHDGVWDIFRVEKSPWYDPKINRLTRHGDEPSLIDDLSARYYIAWDNRFLYLGAEVTDNVNDVDDPQHQPKRWYFKDAICWFLEIPRDNRNERFGDGDHAFCFIADARRPDYAAWHRYGTPTESYREEPLRAVQWALRRGRNGDFTLEAKVDLLATTGITPKLGDLWGLSIVHTDPDGGAYGGHLLLYGQGDDDNTWGLARLVAERHPPERLPH